MKLLLSSVFLILSTTLLHAEENKPASNSTLGKISVEDNNDASIVTIRLDSKPTWTDYQVKDHGTFIQVNLPQTIVPNPGEFTNGAGPIVQKIAAFQSPENTAGVRLFLSEDAALVKQALKQDLLGDRILITVDHKKLAELVSKDPANTAASASMTSAQQVIETTKVNDTIDPPAEKIKLKKSSNITTPPVFKQTPQLTKQLTNVSIFSGILLFGLIVFHLIRSRFKIRRNRTTDSKFQEEALKLISSHVLAPKQKIQLLEICGQKILLSVSPEGINYLTSIPEPSKPQTVSQRLPEQSVSQTTRVVPPRQEHPKQLSGPKPVQQSNTTGYLPNKAQVANRYSQKQQPVATAKHDSQSATAINDVTKLIREKLKNLPAI